MKSAYLVGLVLYVSSCAHAQQAANETNAMLFLESVSMEKRAVVCASRAPEFAEQFPKALSSWRARNSAAITQGEALMRSDSEQNNIPFQSSVEQVTAIDAQLLQQAPIELLRHNCAGFIEAMNNG